MKTLSLSPQQADSLKGLLAMLMSNQTRTDLQTIVNVNEQCLFFLQQLSKPDGEEGASKEIKKA